MRFKRDSFTTLPLYPFILGRDRKRDRFKPGQEEKYLKSLKRVLLQPYVDINYSESYLEILCNYVDRYIKYCKTYTTLTPNTVDEVLKLVTHLHKYNVNTAKVTSTYPWCPAFTDVLLQYVILECKILYTIHFGSPSNELKTQARILKLLLYIIGTFYEYEGVPGSKIFNESAKIILKMCKRIRKTFDLKYNILETITTKLLDKLGVLQQMKELSRQRSHNGSSQNMNSLLENEYHIHRLFEENENKEYTYQEEKNKSITSHIPSDLNSLNKNNQKVKEYVKDSQFSSGITSNSSVNTYSQMSHERYTPSNFNYQSGGFISLPPSFEDQNNSNIKDQNNSNITSLRFPAFNVINLNTQNSNVNIQNYRGKPRPQKKKERNNHIPKPILLKNDNDYQIQEEIIISDDDDDLIKIEDKPPVSIEISNIQRDQSNSLHNQNVNKLLEKSSNNSHKNSCEKGISLVKLVHLVDQSSNKSSDQGRINELTNNVSNNLENRNSLSVSLVLEGHQDLNQKSSLTSSSELPNQELRVSSGKGSGSITTPNSKEDNVISTSPVVSTADDLKNAVIENSFKMDMDRRKSPTNSVSEIEDLQKNVEKLNESQNMLDSREKNVSETSVPETASPPSDQSITESPIIGEKNNYIIPKSFVAKDSHKDMNEKRFVENKPIQELNESLGQQYDSTTIPTFTGGSISKPTVLQNPVLVESTSEPASTDKTSLKPLLSDDQVAKKSDRLLENVNDNTKSLAQIEDLNVSKEKRNDSLQSLSGEPKNDSENVCKEGNSLPMAGSTESENTIIDIPIPKSFEIDERHKSLISINEKKCEENACISGSDMITQKQQSLLSTNPKSELKSVAKQSNDQNSDLEKTTGDKPKKGSVQNIVTEKTLLTTISKDQNSGSIRYSKQKDNLENTLTSNLRDDDAANIPISKLGDPEIDQSNLQDKHSIKSKKELSSCQTNEHTDNGIKPAVLSNSESKRRDVRSKAKGPCQSIEDINNESKSPSMSGFDSNKQDLDKCNKISVESLPILYSKEKTSVSENGDDQNELTMDIRGATKKNGSEVVHKDINEIKHCSTDSNTHKTHDQQTGLSTIQNSDADVSSETTSQEIKKNNTKPNDFHHCDLVYSMGNNSKQKSILHTTSLETSVSDSQQTKDPCKELNSVQLSDKISNEAEKSSESMPLVNSEDKNISNASLPESGQISTIESRLKDPQEASKSRGTVRNNELSRNLQNPENTKTDGEEKLSSSTGSGMANQGINDSIEMSKETVSSLSTSRLSSTEKNYDLSQETEDPSKELNSVKINNKRSNEAEKSSESMQLLNSDDRNNLNTSFPQSEQISTIESQLKDSQETSKSRGNILDNSIRNLQNSENMKTDGEGKLSLSSVSDTANQGTNDSIEMSKEAVSSLSASSLSSTEKNDDLSQETEDPSKELNSVKINNKISNEAEKSSESMQLLNSDDRNNLNTSVPQSEQISTIESRLEDSQEASKSRGNVLDEPIRNLQNSKNMKTDGEGKLSSSSGSGMVNQGINDSIEMSRETVSSLSTSHLSSTEKNYDLSQETEYPSKELNSVKINNKRSNEAEKSSESMQLLNIDDRNNLDTSLLQSEQISTVESRLEDSQEASKSRGNVLDKPIRNLQNSENMKTDGEGKLSSNSGMVNQGINDLIEMSKETVSSLSTSSLSSTEKNDELSQETEDPSKELNSVKINNKRSNEAEKSSESMQLVNSEDRNNLNTSLPQSEQISTIESLLKVSQEASKSRDNVKDESIRNHQNSENTKTDTEGKLSSSSGSGMVNQEIMPKEAVSSLSTSSLTSKQKNDELSQETEDPSKELNSVKINHKITIEIDKSSESMQLPNSEDRNNLNTSLPQSEPISTIESRLKDSQETSKSSPEQKSREEKTSLLKTGIMPSVSSPLNCRSSSRPVLPLLVNLSIDEAIKPTKDVLGRTRSADKHLPENEQNSVDKQEKCNGILKNQILHDSNQNYNKSVDVKNGIRTYTRLKSLYNFKPVRKLKGHCKDSIKESELLNERQKTVSNIKSQHLSELKNRSLIQQQMMDNQNKNRDLQIVIYALPNKLFVDQKFQEQTKISDDEKPHHSLNKKCGTNNLVVSGLQSQESSGSTSVKETKRIQLSQAHQPSKSKLKSHQPDNSTVETENKDAPGSMLAIQNTSGVDTSAKNSEQSELTTVEKKNSPKSIKELKLLPNCHDSATSSSVTQVVNSKENKSRNYPIRHTSLSKSKGVPESVLHVEKTPEVNTSTDLQTQLSENHSEKSGEAAHSELSGITTLENKNHAKSNEEIKLLPKRQSSRNTSVSQVVKSKDSKSRNDTIKPRNFSKSKSVPESVLDIRKTPEVNTCANLQTQLPEKDIEKSAEAASIELSGITTLEKKNNAKSNEKLKLLPKRQSSTTSTSVSRVVKSNDSKLRNDTIKPPDVSESKSVAESVLDIQKTPEVNRCANIQTQLSENHSEKSGEAAHSELSGITTLEKKNNSKSNEGVKLLPKCQDSTTNTSVSQVVKLNDSKSRNDTIKPPDVSESKSVAESVLDIQKTPEVNTCANIQTQRSENISENSGEAAHSELSGIITLEKKNNSKSDEGVNLLPKCQDSTTNTSVSQVVKSKDSKSRNDTIKPRNFSKSKSVPESVLDIQKTPEVNTCANLQTQLPEKEREKSAEAASIELSGITTLEKKNNAKSNEELKLLPKRQSSTTSTSVSRVVKSNDSKLRNDTIKPPDVSESKSVAESVFDIQKTPEVNTCANIQTQLSKNHSEKSGEAAHSELSGITTLEKKNSSKSNEGVKLLPKCQDSTTNTSVSQVVKSKDSKSRNDATKPPNVTKPNCVPETVLDIQKTPEVNTSANLQTQLSEKHSQKSSEAAHSELSGITVEQINNSKSNEEMSKCHDSTSSSVFQLVKSKDSKSRNDAIKPPNVSKSNGVPETVLDIQKTPEVNTCANLQTQLPEKHREKSAEAASIELSGITTLEKKNNAKSNEKLKLLPKRQSSTTSTSVSRVVKSNDSKLRNDTIKPPDVDESKSVAESVLDIQKTPEVNTCANIQTRLSENHSENFGEAAHSELSGITTLEKKNNSKSNEGVKIKHPNVSESKSVAESVLDIQKTPEVNTCANIQTQRSENNSENSGEAAHSELSGITTLEKKNNSKSNEGVKLLPKCQDSTTNTSVSQVVKSKDSKSRNDTIKPRNFSKSKSVPESVLDIQKTPEVNTCANLQTQLPEKERDKSAEAASIEFSGITTLEKKNNAKSNEELKLLPKRQSSTTSTSVSQVVKSNDSKLRNDTIKPPDVSESKSVAESVLDIQKTPEVNTCANILTQLSENNSENSGEAAHSELSGITTLEKKNNSKSNEGVKLLPKCQDSTTNTSVSQVVKSKDSKSRNDTIKPRNFSKSKSVPESVLDIQKTPEVNTCANLQTQLPEKEREKSAEAASIELSGITTLEKKNNAKSNEELKLLPKCQSSTTSTSVSQVVKSNDRKLRNDTIKPPDVSESKSVAESVLDIQKTPEVNTCANIQTQLSKKHSEKSGEAAHSELSGITTLEKKNSSKSNEGVKLLPKCQDSTTNTSVSQVVKSKDSKSRNDATKPPNVTKPNCVPETVLDIQKTPEVNTSANLQTQLSEKHSQKSREAAHSELSGITVEQINNSKSNEEMAKCHDSTSSSVFQLVKSKDSKSRNDTIKPPNVSKSNGVPETVLDIQKTPEVNTCANLQTQLPEKREKSAEAASLELSEITTLEKKNNAKSNEQLKLLPKRQSSRNTSVSQVVKSNDSKSRNDTIKHPNVSESKSVAESLLDIQKTPEVNTCANLQIQLSEKHYEKSSEAAHSELSGITTLEKKNNSKSNDKIKLLPKCQDSTTSTSVSQVVKSKDSKSRNDTIKPPDVSESKSVAESVLDIQKTPEVNTCANIQTQLSKKHSEKSGEAAHSELSGITTLEKKNSSKSNEGVKLLPKCQDSTTNTSVSQVVKSKDSKSRNDATKPPNVTKPNCVPETVLDIQKTPEVNTSANLQTQLSEKHSQKSREAAHSELSGITVEQINNSKSNEEMAKCHDSTSSSVFQLVKSKDSKSRNDTIKPPNVSKSNGVPETVLDIQKTPEVNTCANLQTQLPEKREKSAEAASLELSEITTLEKKNNAKSNEQLKLLAKRQSSRNTSVSQVVKSNDSKSRNDTIKHPNVSESKSVAESLLDIQKTPEVNTCANLQIQLSEKHYEKSSEAAHSELSGITTLEKKNNSKSNDKIKLLPKCQDSTTSTSVSQVVKSKDSKSRNDTIKPPDVSESKSVAESVLDIQKTPEVNTCANIQTQLSKKHSEKSGEAAHSELSGITTLEKKNSSKSNEGVKLLPKCQDSTTNTSVSQVVKSKDSKSRNDATKPPNVTKPNCVPETVLDIQKTPEVNTSANLQTQLSEKHSQKSREAAHSELSGITVEQINNSKSNEEMAKCHDSTSSSVFQLVKSKDSKSRNDTIKPPNVSKSNGVPETVLDIQKTPEVNTCANLQTQLPEKREKSAEAASLELSEITTLEKKNNAKSNEQLKLLPKRQSSRNTSVSQVVKSNDSKSRNDTIKHPNVSESKSVAESLLDIQKTPEVNTCANLQIQLSEKQYEKSSEAAHSELSGITTLEKKNNSKSNDKIKLLPKCQDSTTSTSVSQVVKSKDSKSRNDTIKPPDVSESKSVAESVLDIQKTPEVNTCANIQTHLSKKHSEKSGEAAHSELSGITTLEKKNSSKSNEGVKLLPKCQDSTTNTSVSQVVKSKDSKSRNDATKPPNVTKPNCVPETVLDIQKTPEVNTSANLQTQLSEKHSQKSREAAHSELSGITVEQINNSKSNEEMAKCHDSTSSSVFQLVKSKDSKSRNDTIKPPNVSKSNGVPETVLDIQKTPEVNTCANLQTQLPEKREKSAEAASLELSEITTLEKKNNAKSNEQLKLLPKRQSSRNTSVSQVVKSNDSKSRNDTIKHPNVSESKSVAESLLDIQKTPEVNTCANLQIQLSEKHYEKSSEAAHSELSGITTLEKKNNSKSNDKIKLLPKCQDSTTSTSVSQVVKSKDSKSRNDTIKPPDVSESKSVAESVLDIQKTPEVNTCANIQTQLSKKHSEKSGEAAHSELSGITTLEKKNSSKSNEGVKLLPKCQDSTTNTSVSQVVKSKDSKSRNDATKPPNVTKPNCVPETVLDIQKTPEVNTSANLQTQLSEKHSQKSREAAHSELSGITVEQINNSKSNEEMAKCHDSTSSSVFQLVKSKDSKSRNDTIKPPNVSKSNGVPETVLDIQKTPEVNTCANLQTQLPEKREKSAEAASLELSEITTLEKKNNAKSNEQLKLLAKRQSSRNTSVSQVVKSNDSKSRNDTIKHPNVSESKSVAESLLDIQKTPEVNTCANLQIQLSEKHYEKSSEAAHSELSGITTLEKKNNSKSNDKIKLLPKCQDSTTSTSVSQVVKSKDSKSRNDTIKPPDVSESKSVAESVLDIQKTPEVNTCANIQTQLSKKHSEKSGEAAHSELSGITTLEKKNSSKSNEGVKLLPKCQDSTTNTSVSQVVKSKDSKSRNDATKPPNVTKPNCVPETVLDIQKTPEVNTSANLQTQLSEKHSQKSREAAHSELSGITVEQINNSKSNEEMAKCHDSTSSSVFQLVKSKDSKSRNDTIKPPNVSKSNGVPETVLDIQKTPEVNTCANLQTQLPEKREKSAEAASLELSEITTLEKKNNAKSNEQLKLLPKRQSSRNTSVSQVVKSNDSKSRNDTIKHPNVSESKSVAESLLDIQKTPEVNTCANLQIQLSEKHYEKSSEAAHSELSGITTLEKKNNSKSNDKIKLLPKCQDSTTSTSVSQVVKSKDSKSRNDTIKPPDVSESKSVAESVLDIQKTPEVNTCANIQTQLSKKHSEKSGEAAHSELSGITTLEKKNSSKSNEGVKLLPKCQDSTTNTSVSQVVKSKDSKSRNDATKPPNVTKPNCVPETVLDIQKTPEVNTSANLQTQLSEKHSQKSREAAHSELSGITVEQINNSKSNEEMAKCHDSTSSSVFQLVKSKDSKSRNDTIKPPNVSKSNGVPETVLDIQKTPEVNTCANLQTQLPEKREKSAEAASLELSEITTLEKKNNAKSNEQLKLLPKRQSSRNTSVSQVVKSNDSKSRNDTIKHPNVSESKSVAESLLDIQKTPEVNTCANLQIQLSEKHYEKSSEAAHSELSGITTLEKKNNSKSNDKIKLLPKCQDSTTSTSVSQVVKSKDSKSRNDTIKPRNFSKSKSVPESVLDIQKTPEVNTCANLQTQLSEKHSEKSSEAAHSELSGVTTLEKKNNSKSKEEKKLLPKCQDSTTSTSVSQVVKSKARKSRKDPIKSQNVESSQSKELPLPHESPIENEKTLGVPVSNEELENNLKDATKSQNVVSSINESQKSTENQLTDQVQVHQNQNNKRKRLASGVSDIQTRKLRKTSNNCETPNFLSVVPFESHKKGGCDEIPTQKDLVTIVKSNGKRRISDYQEEELKQFCQETGKICFENSNLSNPLNNIPGMKNKLNAKLLENKTTDSKIGKLEKRFGRKYTNKKSSAQTVSGHLKPNKLNKTSDDCVAPSKNDSHTEKSESNNVLPTNQLPSNPEMTRKSELDDMTPEVFQLANEDGQKNDILSVETPQKPGESKSKSNRYVSRKIVNREVSEAVIIPDTEKVCDSSSGVDKLNSETSSFKLNTVSYNISYPTEKLKNDIKPTVTDKSNLKRTKASQKCFEIKPNDQILLENDTDETQIPLGEAVSDMQTLQECSSIENIDRPETRSMKKRKSISENIFDPIELNFTESCTSSVEFVESVLLDVQEEVEVETTPFENNETIPQNEIEDLEDVPLSKRLEDLKKQNTTISKKTQRSSEVVEHFSMKLTKNLTETVSLSGEVPKNEKLDYNEISPIPEGNTDNADNKYSHKKLRRESFHQQGSRDFVPNTPSTADLGESHKKSGRQTSNDHVPSTPTTTELFSNLKNTVAPTCEKLRRKLEGEFTNIASLDSKSTTEALQGKNPNVPKDKRIANLRRCSRRTQGNQNNSCDPLSIEGSLNHEVGISKESIPTQENSKSDGTFGRKEMRAYSNDNVTVNEEIPNTELLKSNSSKSHKRKKTYLTVPQVDIKESLEKKTADEKIPKVSSSESNNFKKSSSNVKIFQQTQGLNRIKNESRTSPAKRIRKEEDTATKTVSDTSEIIGQQKVEKTTNSIAIDHLMTVVSSELEQVFKASRNVDNQQLPDVRTQQISPGNFTMNTLLFNVIPNQILEVETGENTKIQETVAEPETETFVESTVGENPCSTTTDFQKQSETSHNRKRTLDKDQEDENEEITLKQQKIMEFLSNNSALDPISLEKQIPDDDCNLQIIPVEGVPEIANEINFEALAGVDVDHFITDFPLLVGNTSSNTNKNQNMDAIRNSDHDYHDHPTIGVQDCYLHIGTPVNMEQNLSNQSTGEGEDQVNERLISSESIQTENSQSMQSVSSTDNQNDNQTDPDNSIPSFSVFFDLEDFLESFNSSGQPVYHTPCVDPNEVQNTSTSKLPESPQFKSFSRKDSNDATSEKKDILLQYVGKEDCQTGVAKDLLNDIANAKVDTKLTTENSTDATNKPTVSSTSTVPQQGESPQSNNKPRSNILQNLTKNNGAKVIVIPSNQSQIIEYVNYHSYAAADSSVSIKESRTTETQKATFPPARTYSRSHTPSSPKNKPRRNQATNGKSSKITMEDLVHVRKLRNNRHPDPPESAPALSIIKDGVEVTWENKGNKDIDAYVIEYSVEGSKTWKTYTCNGNCSSYVVKDLQPGQTYVFRIKVYNFFGVSPYTPESKMMYSDNNVKGPQSPKSETAGTSLDTKGSAQLNYSIDNILKDSQKCQLNTSIETNESKEMTGKSKYTSDVLFDQVRDSSYVNPNLQKKLMPDNKVKLEPVGTNKKSARDLPVEEEVKDKHVPASNLSHCNRGSVQFPTKSGVREESKMDWHNKYFNLCVQRNWKPLPNSIPDDKLMSPNPGIFPENPASTTKNLQKQEQKPD